MTGTLRLSANVNDDSVGLTTGIAVRIEQFGADGEIHSSWTVLLPSDPRGLMVEVPAGSYRLQAWLPSGEILLRSASVKEGASSHVVFKATTKPIGRRSGSETQVAREYDLSKEFHPLEFQPAFTIDAEAELDETYLESVDLCVDHPSLSSWANASEGYVGEQFAELDNRELQFDGTTSSLSIASSPDAHEVLSNRWWIRFRHSSGVSVGTLPIQWLSSSATGLGRGLIDVRFQGRLQRLEVVIRDGRLDALLAYLRYGRISAAEMAVDALTGDGIIMDALREKRANPLAACAAAYVSLATANRKQLDQWRSWAVNLMEWFPWVPDGAIIRACVLMDGEISTEVRRDILNAAKDSYRRGLPFFTVGLKHLREILTIFGGDDPEAEKMLDSVRSISARCDISETFTTLQFPSH